MGYVYNEVVGERAWCVYVFEACSYGFCLGGADNNWNSDRPVGLAENQRIGSAVSLAV